MECSLLKLLFCLMKAKFEPNLPYFMFRLLNILLRKWKMCQLEAKIEAKETSYIFTSEAYDCLNQVLLDLREPTKKWKNVIYND